MEELIQKPLPIPQKKVPKIKTKTFNNQNNIHNMRYRKNNTLLLCSQYTTRYTHQDNSTKTYFTRTKTQDKKQPKYVTYDVTNQQVHTNIQFVIVCQSNLFVCVKTYKAYSYHSCSLDHLSVLEYSNLLNTNLISWHNNIHIGCKHKPAFHRFIDTDDLGIYQKKTFI
jgi:hypothetical protein